MWYLYHKNKQNNNIRLFLDTGIGQRHKNEREKGEKRNRESTTNNNNNNNNNTAAPPPPPMHRRKANIAILWQEKKIDFSDLR